MEIDGDVEEIVRFDFFSSSSGAGSSSSSSSDSGTPAPPTRRRPIPRKGHTKSRRGCYNCKRRKVKCQETLPECGHCRRIGLVCEYPPEPKPQQQLLLQALTPSRALQSTPTLFSMDDLRFFQHFLLTAYPPLPIKGDAVWRDVAVISHHFDYLIHAMLGLAASHLSLQEGVDFTQQALAHRVTAITLVNKSLDRPCASKAEGDARFATMMALTFQSSCMDEGMLDFLSMIRGCGVVSQTGMMPNLEDSLFRTFSREAHIETVKRLHETPLEPVGDQRVVEEFLASVRGLGPLCHSALEINWLATIERVMKLARVDPVDAFAESASLYGLITESTNEDFLALVDPQNFVAQVLLIHFFLIEYVIGELVLAPIIDKAFPFRKRLVIGWLRRVRDGLPDSFQHYIQWPMQFADALLERDLLKTPQT